MITRTVPMINNEIGRDSTEVGGHFRDMALTILQILLF